MKAGEEKMVEWISRDVTRATPPELASPLEIEGSVVSEAYHYVILQFQSFQHHVQLSLEYLEQEYGDQLTEENVQDYFKVNPFLDDQEYNYLEEKLLKKFQEAELNDQPSTSSGLYQEEVDNLTASSSHSEPTQPATIWRPNTSELEDFHRTVDDMVAENDRRERLAKGNELKKRVIEKGWQRKEEDRSKIGAFYEKKDRDPFQEDSESDDE